MAEKFAKFAYVTGPYSFRFTCRANGYKIHFYRSRAHLVKDEESIKQLRGDPFFKEVGPDAPADVISVDSTETRTDSSQTISTEKSTKKGKKKKAPKLSKAVESKGA